MKFSRSLLSESVLSAFCQGGPRAGSDWEQNSALAISIRTDPSTSNSKPTIIFGQGRGNTRKTNVFCFYKVKTNMPLQKDLWFPVWVRDVSHQDVTSLVRPTSESHSLLRQWWLRDPGWDRETFYGATCYTHLLLLSTERRLIYGLVEFNSNIIDNIVWKGDPVSFKSNSCHWWVYCVSQHANMPIMLLDNCVFRWAVPIPSGPHRFF